MYRLLKTIKRDEKDQLRRTLTRRLSSMAKRSGLDTSILETSVPNIPESALMIACNQITNNLIGSKIQSDYGSILSVRLPMNMIGQLFSATESNEINFRALANLSSLSAFVNELRSESRETQNVLKRALESRDGLVNLIIQMVKSTDSGDDDLLADFSSRASSKILDLAKVKNLTTMTHCQ